MAKVTVLVAVYNAAPYLSHCLDSLVRQTLTDFQVVCVDDCSTDSSPAILDAYARRDRRLSVIRLKENHGQAYARNVGLAVAEGEFVCMLDADDWFSDDALEQAVAVFDEHSKADAVLFDVMMEYADRSERYVMPSFDVITGSEAFRLSLTWKVHGLYMIRTDIHRRIPYDDSCRLYSDDNTTRLHYVASREVRPCGGVYHYRQHNGSATHAASVRRFDRLRADESMLRQMEKLGIGSDLLNEYENQRWLNLVDTYMFYHCHNGELSCDECKYGLKEMKRVWNTVDKTVLDSGLTSKFGYRLMPSWRLFRLQEWAYFTLRGLLGKNR